MNTDLIIGCMAALVILLVVIPRYVMTNEFALRMLNTSIKPTPRQKTYNVVFGVGAAVLVLVFFKVVLGIGL